MNAATGEQAFKRAPAIVLHYADEGGRVRIVPPDMDTMTISVEMAIEACRAFHHQLTFKNQFDLLLTRLAEWIAEHAGKIADAFLTCRDSGLLFLVVLNGKKFDQGIETSLTELDLLIANDDDFSLISLAVHAIPQSSEDTTQSFISPKMSLKYRREADAKRE